jgi:hypothetical protein
VAPACQQCFLKGGQSVAQWNYSTAACLLLWSHLAVGTLQYSSTLLRLLCLVCAMTFLQLNVPRFGLILLHNSTLLRLLCLDSWWSTHVHDDNFVPNVD